MLLPLWLGWFPAQAAERPSPENFQLNRLVAWCIVPFDAQQRGPAARAAMVKRLGLQRVAYDWRQEHVSQFEEEIQQYQQQGIEFFAFWNWHDALAPLIEKYGVKPQIWITNPSPSAVTEEARVAAAAHQLLPLVERTRELGCHLGLYNHGGWGGTPANLIAVCEYLRNEHGADHVGIVYNFHHAHDDLVEFDQQLTRMLPYLICLNLNGMADAETVRQGRDKILPIGSGKHERTLIESVIRSGYRGPVGVIDHRNELDAELSLRQNLDGLQQLLRELLVGSE